MGSHARSDPNRPNGLLAALVPFGVLVQPEVALTRSISWLLGLEGAAGALDRLVLDGGVVPESGGFWLTEVVGEDRGRTDLEYWWGEPPSTRVVVEAKLGHTMTVEQIEGYATERLNGDSALLVVLVPEVRRKEGESVVDAYRAGHPAASVKVAVWTYDDVLRELEAGLPGSPDVAQFRGLVLAARALDILPMTEAELIDDNPVRRQDIWRVVDSASFGLFGRNSPSGSDGSLENRRYVTLVPYEIALAVGVGRKPRGREGQSQPWAWLRLPDSSSFAKVGQPVLERMRPGETSRDPEGVWLPLRLPVGEPGSIMIQQVRAEIEVVGTAIRDAIDHAVETELDGITVGHKKSVTAVLGMAPIDPADLVDDSPARRADIELLLREAARGFYDGKIWPKVPDREYDYNRYVPLTPVGGYISTSMSRQTPAADDTPQPWAWLRVHEDTANAEIAYEVLERMAPGRVVVDPHGRAIPFNVPTDAEGPRMLEAVRGQIWNAIIGIRDAVRAQNTSARQGPED
jgi:hypothetical protein